MIFEIPYQEVDCNRRIRLYTLENHMLTAAGIEADEHGYGIKYLLPKGLTWVITRLSLEMTYLPKHGEKIRIDTWVERYAHMLSVRNFRIYLLDGDGEKQIGEAQSIWTVLDLKKREIVDASSFPPFQHCEGEPLSMSRAPRFVNIENPDKKTTHTINYSDIDYNGHCNSCRYLEIALNALEPHGELFPLRLDINYTKEVKLGESLHIILKATEEDARFALKKDDGSISCLIQLGKLRKQIRAL